MSTPNDAGNPQNPYMQQPQDGQNNPYGQQQQQPYGFQGQNQQYAQQPYGQPYVQPAIGQKSKVVAGILGILLGGLGIHNFYLGRNGRGVAQLLITVLSAGFLSWVSGIWGLVEGILILVSKPGDEWHRDARGFELRD